jgi:uncharacterized protein YdhG (YjbR/CyaY superfamily)
MAEAKRAAKKPDGAEGVLAVIAEMPEPDRTIAEKLHATITKAAPELTPKLWYGQPAYARGGAKGKVIVFFRGAAIDGERYVSLGFSGNANLDDGNVWPTAYAVTKVTAADAKTIATLVKRAASD